MANVVMVYGTFDIIHRGHINLIRKAHELTGIKGKVLVGVSRDGSHHTDTGDVINPCLSQYERCLVVSGLKYVDHVMLQPAHSETRSQLRRLAVTHLVLGTDWAQSEFFNSLRDVVALVFVRRTAGISSTLIKEAIKNGTVLGG